MPFSLDRTAPRHTGQRKDAGLADADFVAGQQSLAARIQRVFRHPASHGNERVAADLLLVHGLPADQAIAVLSQQAPIA